MATFSLEQRPDHYTVTHAPAALSPAAAYAAWAAELSLPADTTAALNDDDRGWPVTLGQAFFPSGSTTAVVSSEAGIGFYDAAPGSTTSASYALSGQGVSRFFGLTTRPTMLLTYHPQSDLRSENARFEQSAAGSIYYSEHRNWGAQTFRCHVAARIVAGRLDVVIEAFDQPVPVKLFELTQANSLTVRQRLDVVTLAAGERIALTVGPLELPLLQAPALFGVVPVEGQIAIPTLLGAPRVRASIAIPEFPETNIRYEADLSHNGQSVILPISSWQATQQIDRANYLQTVVPSADQYVDQIAALQAGQLAIYRLSQLTNGDPVRVEMARSTINELTYAQGPFRTSVTLAGYMQSDYAIGGSPVLSEPPELFVVGTVYADDLGNWGHDVPESTDDRTAITALVSYGDDTGGRTQSFTVAETTDITVEYFNDTDSSGQVGIALVPAAGGSFEFSEFTNFDTEGWASATWAVPAGEWRFQFWGAVWTNIAYADVVDSRRSVRLPKALIGGDVLFAPNVRTMRNIRSMTVTNGKRRLRCDVDWFLRPGMSAQYGPDPADLMTVSWISYFVGAGQEYMELGERDL